MHVHWAPARNSMGASLIRGLWWRERCRWVGFCGGLLLFMSTSVCCIIRTGCVQACPLVGTESSFTKFILKGFSPIYDKNSSGLVQAQSARPKTRTEIVELKLSHFFCKHTAALIYRQTDGNIYRKLQSLIRYENRQWNLCGMHTTMNHPSWILILQ